MNRKKIQWLILVFLFISLISAPAFLQTKPYWLSVAAQAFYYAILASSWSLLAGTAGQFSFGHMAFMGIAAYASGILGRDLGTSPLVGIILGTLISAFVGLIIGILCLRLKKTYLALFTIAFAEILRLGINAELNFTGGPNGLYMERLIDTTSYVPYYYLLGGLLVVVLGFMHILTRSRFGLFFLSIREDEEAAAAMGVHVVRYKIMAFVITSAIAGLAGAVDAHFIGFIAPNMILISRMSLVIAMAVIGGVESQIGAALGAIFIHFSLEWLQEIPVPSSIFPYLKALTPTLENIGLGVGSRGILTYAWRSVGFGLLLMLTLRFWRNGLIYPFIEKIFRRPAQVETVAIRQQYDNNND